MANVHPQRDEAVAMARACYQRGMTENETREHIRAEYADVSARTVKRWATEGWRKGLESDPGNLEDARRVDILDSQDREEKLWRLGFACVGGEGSVDSVSASLARDGAFGANQYFTRAIQLRKHRAQLSHWYVIPPERDLESPEVREIVAQTIANNAAAFDVCQLDEMVVALRKARDEKLAESDVVDMAARRSEMERVL